MKEFIERAKVLESLGYEEKRRGDVLPGSTFDIILQEPTADVAEVRHGRWLTTDAYPHHLYCSVCYKTYAKNAKWVNELDLPTNYCPSCGALMDKEDEHEAG